MPADTGMRVGTVHHRICRQRQTEQEAREEEARQGHARTTNADGTPRLSDSTGGDRSNNHRDRSLRIAKLLQAGYDAADVAEQVAKLMPEFIIRRGVVPQAQDNPFQTAVAALAFAGKAFAKRGEAAVHQAHPDLPETRFPAEAEVGSSAAF